MFILSASGMLEKKCVFFRASGFLSVSGMLEKKCFLLVSGMLQKKCFFACVRYA